MKLYHYTDSSAVKAILEHGKLWLSDIRYLNDHSEYKDGETVVRSVFQQRSGGLPKANSTKILTHLESYFDNSKLSYTFIGSFSRGEDLLSQWRGYCLIDPLILRAFSRQLDAIVTRRMFAVEQED